MSNLMGVGFVSGVAGIAIGFLLGRFMGRSSVSEEKGKEQAVELYVGNLPYEMTEQDIRKLFAKHGQVVAVRLIKNKGSGRSKGYGFVEMTGKESARKAVSALSGGDVQGRKLVVNEAKSQSRDT